MSAGQRVRVTIEGTRTKGDPDPVMRLRTDEGTLVFLPTRDAGVSVEDVTPERVWTDGDVLQNSVHGWTLTRTRGEWLLSNGSGPWDDSDVTEALTDPRDPYSGELAVLRYQADA